jgi:hypothetical protein
MFRKTDSSEADFHLLTFEQIFTHLMSVDFYPPRQSGFLSALVVWRMNLEELLITQPNPD